jgi:hypothetical protein
MVGNAHPTTTTESQANNKDGKMLTVYRPRKWMLPALVSRDDLLLLKTIHSYQTNDKKQIGGQVVP